MHHCGACTLLVHLDLEVRPVLGNNAACVNGAGYSRGTIGRFAKNGGLRVVAQNLLC